MSDRRRILYMCEVCLAASERPMLHHGRMMIECDAGREGDDDTQPVTDAAGRILTHAPKWWVFRHRQMKSGSPGFDGN